MSLQPTTIELDEVRARLLSRPATVTDGELLGVVIGRGARRKPGTDPGIHRTAVEVGRAILAEAGGLAGFVRTADDTLQERDGVGQGLASCSPKAGPTVPRVAAPRRRYTYRGHSPRRPATSADDARRREDAAHCGRGTSRKNGESVADSGPKHAQSRTFDQC